MKVSRDAVLGLPLETVGAVALVDGHNARAIDRNAVKGAQKSVFAEDFFFDESSDQGRLKPFELMVVEQDEHVVDSVHVRKALAKELLKILCEDRVIAIEIHGIARSLLTDKHEETAQQDLGHCVTAPGPRINDILKSNVEVRDEVIDGAPEVDGDLLARSFCCRSVGEFC